ncbi:MAG: rane protein [Paenibacillaceae bacterium]|jgi:putative membrane protein|nr:rane protein [Paenibacillaceae bacterium]
MNDEVDRLTASPYLETLAFFSVALVAVVVFLAVFEMITRYSVWNEIKRGNLAVAMATSGKIFGICNIFRYAIAKNDTILKAVGWAGFGFVLLLAAYFIFEFLTPNLNVDEEIGKDNKAVGFIAMILSVSLSFIIGASVT